jgi:cytochrome c oxidase subunit 3
MFFGGVGLGTYLESGDHSGGHHAAADGEHAGEGEHAAGGEHADDEHAADEHSDGVEHAAGSYAEREYAVESNDMFKMAEADRLTDDGPTSTAANIQENQDEQYGYTPSQSHEGEVATATDDEVPMAKVNQPGKAGLFFSIYYCMTGVHAVHILAGMLVISWLIVKAARREFHSKYYGPVDNVGLYWHLVDFIWIYLFPLMYLIG